MKIWQKTIGIAEHLAAKTSIETKGTNHEQNSKKNALEQCEIFSMISFSRITMMC